MRTVAVVMTFAMAVPIWLKRYIKKIFNSVLQKKFTPMKTPLIFLWFFAVSWQIKIFTALYDF
jgi:hypothetical protein